MPNFTSEIKKEILTGFPQNICCGRAVLSALLMTEGTALPDRLEFSSENEKLTEFFVRKAEEIFNVRLEVKGAVFDGRREKDRLTFSYSGEKLEEIYRQTGISDSDFSLVTERGCCALSFVKGAFLGSGSCTLPHGGAKTGYHLEFVCPTERTAEALCETLVRFELLPRYIERGEKFVVYLKSGDAISDFLSIVGAKNSLKSFEKITAARAERNNENRVSNCYAGNADKAAIASAQQAIMIEQMEKSGVLSSLAEPLREAARMRMKYPTYSLNELAAALGVSKSCLNHRMRKLTEIYKAENDHD